MTRPFGVNFIGYLHSEKGLGEAVRALTRASRAAGIPDAHNHFIDPGSDNQVRDLSIRRVGLPYAINLLAVNVDNLNNFALNVDIRRLRQDRYTIGYWFWELTRIPTAWNDRFDSLDEIWVGSTFTQQAVAIASSVPVVCMPPSIESEPQIVPISKSMIGIPENAFVFLFIFDADSTLERKNPLGLIRAFREAFANHPDVCLVLKVSRLENAANREQLLAAVAADPRILLYGGLIARPAILGLIAMADCYVSLHRAEGFGLTLAEAMLLGKPTIATAYSGNLDFMTAQNSLLVDYTMTQLSHDHGPYARGESWADPVINDAAEKMRWVVANRSQAARMGLRAREEIIRKFRPEVVGTTIAERFQVLMRSSQKPARSTSATWQLKIDPLASVRVLSPKESSKVDLTVLEPFPVSPSIRAMLVGRWLSSDGVVLSEPGSTAIALESQRDPNALPVILRSFPITAPAQLGRYSLQFSVEHEGRALSDPFSIQVEVQASKP